MASSPILNMDLLNPAGMMVETIGASIESERSISGASGGAIGISGGGLLQVTYTGCQLFSNAGEHRYLLGLQARLTGGVRKVLAPIINDLIMPVVPKNATYSDGSGYSDGSTYSDKTTFAQTVGATAVGAGSMIIDVRGAKIYEGMVFGVKHPKKNWRAYIIWELGLQSSRTSGGTTIRRYKVFVTPNVREEIPAGTDLDFTRPMVLCRLMPGKRLPWSPKGYWQQEFDLSLEEAF